MEARAVTLACGYLLGDLLTVNHRALIVRSSQKRSSTSGTRVFAFQAWSGRGRRSLASEFPHSLTLPGHPAFADEPAPCLVLSRAGCVSFAHVSQGCSMVAQITGGLQHDMTAVPQAAFAQQMSLELDSNMKVDVNLLLWGFGMCLALRKKNLSSVLVSCSWENQETTPLACWGINPCLQDLSVAMGSNDVLWADVGWARRHTKGLVALLTDAKAGSPWECCGTGLKKAVLVWILPEV